MNHILDKATTDREDDVKDLAKPKHDPKITEWLRNAIETINQE